MHVFLFKSMGNDSGPDKQTQHLGCSLSGEREQCSNKQTYVIRVGSRGAGRVN